MRSIHTSLDCVCISNQLLEALKPSRGTHTGSTVPERVFKSAYSDHDATKELANSNLVRIVAAAAGSRVGVRVCGA